MLAKLKLLKTSKGIDSILMLSGILIVWITTFFYPHHAPAAAAGNAILAAAPVQTASLWLALAIIAVALWDGLRPVALLSRCRKALRILALASVVVPLAIYLLSISTDLMCESAAACPAVGSSWWLLGLCLFWLPARPRVAALFAAAIVLGGLLLSVQAGLPVGYALWSAWTAAYLLYLLYRCFTPDDALA